MERIKGKPGDHIVDAAQRAIGTAKVGAPVELEFNEIVLTVMHGVTAGDVAAEYHRLVDARAAAYRATPEYKERQRATEEKGRQRDQERAAALAKAPAKMTLRDADGWAECCKNNSDGYGSAVIRYAEVWARLMESMIAGGATLSDCAKNASHLADSEGITGFMYGAAVGILAHVWVYGDELRRWHNKEYGVDEDKAKGGTVNPAILTAGGGD